MQFYNMHQCFCIKLYLINELGSNVCYYYSQRASCDKIVIYFHEHTACTSRTLHMLSKPIFWEPVNSNQCNCTNCLVRMDVTKSCIWFIFSEKKVFCIFCFCFISCCFAGTHVCDFTGTEYIDACCIMKMSLSIMIYFCFISNPAPSITESDFATASLLFWSCCPTWDNFTKWILQEPQWSFVCYDSYHINELGDGQAELDDDDIRGVWHGPGPLVVTNEKLFEEFVLRMWMSLLITGHWGCKKGYPETHFTLNWQNKSFLM